MWRPRRPTSSSSTSRERLWPDASPRGRSWPANPGHDHRGASEEVPRHKVSGHTRAKVAGSPLRPGSPLRAGSPPRAGSPVRCRSPARCRFPAPCWFPGSVPVPRSVPVPASRSRLPEVAVTPSAPTAAPATPCRRQRRRREPDQWSIEPVTTGSMEHRAGGRDQGPARNTWEPGPHEARGTPGYRLTRLPGDKAHPQDIGPPRPASRQGQPAARARQPPGPASRQGPPAARPSPPRPASRPSRPGEAASRSGSVISVSPARRPPRRSAGKEARPGPAADGGLRDRDWPSRLERGGSEEARRVSA